MTVSIKEENSKWWKWRLRHVDRRSHKKRGGERAREQLKQLNPADWSCFHTAGKGNSQQSLTCCYYREITGRTWQEQQGRKKSPWSRKWETGNKGWRREESCLHDNALISGKSTFSGINPILRYRKCFNRNTPFYHEMYAFHSAKDSNELNKNLNVHSHFKYFSLTLATISKNIDKTSFSLIILRRYATRTKVRTR